MKNKVLWFTGLSGSGKTTLSNALFKKLNALYHIYIIQLDGDEIREGLCSDLGFSDLDRSENVRRVTEVSKLFLDKGFWVFVSLISPFKKDRENAKKIIGENNFIEIYCSCPIMTICKERDVKGLYQKAINKEIQNFTGISSIYEPSANPDIFLFTDLYTVDECISKIQTYLLKSIPEV